MVDLLVAGECSMEAVPLARHLLRAVRDSASLLFVGDVVCHGRQIRDSILPGNLFDGGVVPLAAGD